MWLAAGLLWSLLGSLVVRGTEPTRVTGAIIFRDVAPYLALGCYCFPSEKQPGALLRHVSLKPDVSASALCICFITSLWYRWSESLTSYTVYHAGGKKSVFKQKKFCGHWCIGEEGSGTTHLWDWWDFQPREILYKTVKIRGKLLKLINVEDNKLSNKWKFKNVRKHIL